MKSDKSFPEAQTVTFDWPAGTDWQDVKVELPVKSSLIHIRITTPESAPEIQIQSITLRAHDGTNRTASFGTSK